MEYMEHNKQKTTMQEIGHSVSVVERSELPSREATDQYSQRSVKLRSETLLLASQYINWNLKRRMKGFYRMETGKKQK